MVGINAFRKLALSYAKATEQPHFEKSSFRVGKKIFATLDAAQHKAVLKLRPVDQSVFCTFDKTIIYPVPGAWGRQGWTLVELKKVPKELLHDALTRAYCTVAPKKFAEKYKSL